MMFHSYWLPFLLAAVVLNITPGPDMIYLISQSITYGKKTGFASILGFGTGALIHSLLVALGLTAIMTTSALAFQVVKTIGAGYLFFMGVTALVQSSSRISFEKEGKPKKRTSLARSYCNAMLVDVTNPKVALFFMAFLPQFYRENGTSRLHQYLTLALIIVAIAFVVEGIIVILSDRISLLLREKPLVSKILDKSFGSILILLGFRLFLQKRT